MSTGPISGGAPKRSLTPEEAYGQLESIPRAVFLKALSYLDQESLHSLALTNKTLYPVALEAARQEQVKIVRNSALFLLAQRDVMKRNPEVSAALQSLSKTVLNGDSLLALKKDQAAAIEILSKQVLKLNEEDLTAIHELAKKNSEVPKPLLTLLELALLHKKVDRLSALPEGFEKWFGLRLVVRSLAELGDIPKAIEVVEMMSRDNWLMYKVETKTAIEILAGVLAKNGDVDRALALTELVHDAHTASPVFCIISKEVTKRGEIDRAIEIARMCKDSGDESMALHEIVQKLMHDPNTRAKALSIAKSVPQRSWRDSALQSVALRYAYDGNAERAQEIVATISDDMRHDARESVTEALKKAKK